MLGMFGTGAGSATLPAKAAANGYSAAAYERHKARAAQKQRDASHAAREISHDYPGIKDPRRRAKALRDFRYFCRHYFPKIFYLPFSPDHLKVISKAEIACTQGGQFALAMPRASGKTAICTALTIWTLFQGTHQVVMLIGATKAAAVELLDGIKVNLSTNDDLAADFPEICYPIRRLEGIHQRRLLWEGKPIRQEYKRESIILPNLPPSPAASASIVVRGITGRIRGFKLTRPDGTEARPSLAIIDDPQTHGSAKSPGQCAERERIINGDIMGLAGPDVPMAALMPCTVIYENDVADRLLDQDRNPQWSGERLKLVYEWPQGTEAETLWEQYAALWKQAQREKRPTTAATSLYRRNRKAMDKGHRVGWPERRYPGTLSAIQHAMNLRYRVGALAFAAEYQNEPHRQTTADETRLDPDQIAAKVTRLPRGIVPITAAHLTAFIDIQQEILPYAVCAWGTDFTGTIIDYGCFPDQKRIYWQKNDIKHPYADDFPGAGGGEAKLYQALARLTDQLLARTWTRDGGQSALSIGLCLIDSGWGQMADTTYQFCRESRHRAILLPSKGKGIGAAHAPLSEWKGKAGDILGEAYRIGSIQSAKRAIPSLLFETNYWKSFAEARLLTPLGARGSLALFGDDATQHRMISDHLSSEWHTRLTAARTGRTVDEWQQTPNRDNDLWDCIVGNCVAAHRLGARLLDDAAPPRPRKKLAITF